MKDFHNETTTPAPHAFTVINGGKAPNAGESHESTIRAVTNTGESREVECKGGMLIRFDQSEMFRNLEGIAVINADIFPPELLMILLKIAIDSRSDN